MATISQTTPAPDVVKPGQPQPTATTVLPAAAQEAQGAATAQPSRLVMLIVAMMKSKPHISDLIFSPGRLPQVEVDGQLVELTFPGINKLSAQDTEQIGRELIGDSEHHVKQLEANGSADISCAVVMRAIPRNIPNFDQLKLPKVLEEIVNLRNGLVLVTGPTGSGKSSTLAAIIGKMNEDKAIHILTIEDPIEFAHNHRKATIHQRELHMDTPTFALALRAALRQAPKVILVGEMRDRETMEVALEASETGHLVLSTLHTIDAAKTVERIIGVFPLSEQQGIRIRLSKAFRFIVSQRLLPRKDGKGRIPAIEVLKSTMRTREYVEKGEAEGKSLLDAMRDGSIDGMQHFDGVIEDFIRNGIVEFDAGMSYATNAGNLRLDLTDFIESEQRAGRQQRGSETELEIERI
jgi:twitching motility protein PilT